MATLLPLGESVFQDQNGTPLAAGSVWFTIPGTDVAKTTWQDSAQIVANTNPIILDSAGRAIIYGSGIYRQRVYASNGDLQWDQLTASTDSGTYAWGGVSTGSANAQVVTASSFSSLDGQQLGFIAGYTNSGALTVNAIPVLRDGLSGPTPLIGNEVIAQNEVSLVYEAARGAFHLVNPALGTIAFQNASNVAITGGTIAGVTVTGATITATSLILPQSAAPTPTVEGSIQWDTDDNQIKVGDGATTKTFSDDSKVAILAATDQTISGGAQVTSLSLGTVSSGTTTLNYGARPMQYYTNNGAHTLAPDTDNGYIILDITNGASAGAITTSGWTKVVGLFTTTNGNKFRCTCSTGQAGSLLSIQAMQ